MAQHVKLTPEEAGALYGTPQAEKLIAGGYIGAGFAHDAHAANCETCHEQQAKLARLKAKNKKLRKALRAVERG
jgi:hypothetical protein